MPGAANVCVAVGIADITSGVKSPQLHEYDAIVLDGAADDADPLKIMTVTVVAGFGEAVKLAVGSLTAPTVIVCVVVAVESSPKLVETLHGS